METETKLDVKVARIFKVSNCDGVLKGFADITVNDAILIKGIRIVEGNNGLFVSMPQEMAKEQDSVYTLDEFQEAINDEVLFLDNSFILID